MQEESASGQLYGERVADCYSALRNSSAHKRINMLLARDGLSDATRNTHVKGIPHASTHKIQRMHVQSQDTPLE